MPLSRTQERQLRCVYHFIVTHCLDHTGLPPTIREIRDGCGLSSTSVAHSCVLDLVECGLLASENGKAHKIQVAGAQWKAPPICPQCLKAHSWGTKHYEWGDIVEEERL